MNTISWAANKMKKSQGSSLDFLNTASIDRAKAFHAGFPEYQPTPLKSLPHLAKALGLGGIYVKDESYRFGLNAFKVLGASFAIANCLAERLGGEGKKLDFATLTSEAARKKLGEITFVTATDGNHGRGVAWTANRLGQNSVVYMPKGSSATRLANIQKEGATASITDLNYDEAVRLAARKAAENNWIMVQDTAWEGYEDIPTWIMQGYGTIAAEAVEQLEEIAVSQPTHVFLQAGVGSFAGAIQGYLASRFGKNRPTAVIVEPDTAACLYKSAIADDGAPHFVTGDMPTIMAGLACGEPNTIGWNVLRDYSDMFFSCPDWVTARGMRLLGNPLRGDERIISGESGAVPAGLLSLLCERDDLRSVKESLHLNEHSHVLLISTEGDTDPEKYRKIVWDGEYASYI